MFWDICPLLYSKAECAKVTISSGEAFRQAVNLL